MSENNIKSGFATIIGRPNVGKSTLLNRVLGQKIAITSPRPQTTRNRIMGIVTEEQYQVVFLDTPGLQRPRNLMEDNLSEAIKKSLKAVDVVIMLADATEREVGPGDRYAISMIKEQPKAKSILALNKIDLLPKDQLLRRMSDYSKEHKFDAIMPISAAKGEGLLELMRELVSYLPWGPQYYPEDQVTDMPERFIIAELIRETIFNQTQEEVPYATAVVTEEVKERADGKVYVQAVIYCETDSQKGILVGQQGSMIKNIGQKSRVKVASLLDKPIYLGLTVKVMKNWRKNSDMLKSLGYYKS